MKLIRQIFAFALLCYVAGNLAPAVAEESTTKSSSETITVSGVFTAGKHTEIQCDHEQLTSLKIKRIVPHGTVVAKGQPLVWFQTDEWDKKVRESEVALGLARIDLEGQRFAFEQFMRTQDLDREAANRKRDHAREDHDYYLKTELPRQIAQAQQSLKSSEFSLESSTEEYKQLLQMYQEDDLTEQSEEIVLRRAKFAMESARFRHEGTIASTARTLNETLPRQKASKEVALQRAMMEHEKAMHDLDLAGEKREIEMAKAAEKFEEQEKKFDELVAERESVVLEAPHDGLFVYGKLSRGKLGPKPIDYQVGAAVTARQVIGTVVRTTKPTVQIELPEKYVGKVRPGRQCTIKSNANPKLQLKGRVKSVSDVAFATGKHDCVVTIKGNIASKILPTTSCEITFGSAKMSSGKRSKDSGQTDEQKDSSDSDENQKEKQ